MVRTIALSPVRVAWVVGTALVVLFGMAEPSWAQFEAPKPRVRSLLKAGIDSNKRGDYDAAAKYYEMVEAGKRDLNPAEQNDFAKLVEQNTKALQGRRDGTIQIQMTQSYLEQGNTAEAAKLIRAVGTNPYLSPADKQALSDLTERLRTASAGAIRHAKMMSEPVNKDIKSLLTAARKALARGELEMAEAFCAQADKVGYTIHPIFHPWSDTPAKVRRDIQTARVKLTTPPPVVAVEKKESSGPFAFVKGWFGSKPKEETPSRVEPRDPPPLAKGPGKLVPKQEGPIHHATAYPTPKDATAKAPTLPKYDVQPASVGGAADKTRAIQLINEGYLALERGDTAAAQKLALQAKALRPDLAWWERNPDRLLSDIERRGARPTQIAGAPPAKGTPAEARNLVKEARTFLSQNRFEDAEKLSAQAAGISGMRWGLFEDNPDKVRGDIQKARARRDREEAGKLLVEARSLYQAGNYHEAKVKAWQAQKLHGPYSIWDLGDRPQKLLDEIHRAELKFKSDPKLGPGSSRLTPGSTGTVADGKDAPIQQIDRRGAPASVASVERQKAVVLLAQARDLQKRGRLAQARDKAVEAKKLGVVFGPDEDNPDAALWSLNALCDANVQAYMKRAVDAVMNSPTDAERFTKAQADLESARQLALAFRHDLAAVDQKMLWLQQAALASGASPVGPSGMPPAIDGVASAGKTKLDQARLELRAGNTRGARRLAVEAHNPAFGVQEEALMVLRSIDAEEGNQVRLDAERNARAGIDAFLRRDYRMASSLLSSFDRKLLPPDLFARVREILGAPEMIQGVDTPAIARKDGAPDPDGKTGVIRTSAVDVRDDADDKFRAMEKIQFQQMQDRTLVTLSNAHDLMSRGMADQAIDLLNEQLGQFQSASLEPALVAPLKRQIDFRIQQYRTLQAQAALEGQTIKVRGPNPEAERNRSIAKNQAKVKEKMDQYRALMKEGKYKEAQTAALQAQALDPDHLAAAAGAQIAETKQRIWEWERNKKKNDQGWLDDMGNDHGDWVNPRNPLSLNQEALDRSKKRSPGGGLATMGKTAFQRAVEEKLLHPVNVKFVNTPLEQVLEVLRTEAGGVNMIPDRKALLEESVSLDQPITESLENLSLKSALNVILGQAKLTYVIRDDYISITTPREAKGKIKQVVHPVADLVIPVVNHPGHTTNNMQEALMRQINRQSGVVFQPPSPYTPGNGLPPGAPASSYASGLGSAFASGSAAPPSGPGYSPPRSNGSTIEEMLMSLITDTIAHDTWSNMGGPGTVRYYPLGMALVINQSQEVQEEVFALLQALRRLQDLEVAIEMKLVNVSEAFFERLGLDFDVNFRTGTSRREPDLLTSNFTPFGFVNRNLDRLGLVSGLTPAGTLTPDLNIPLRSSSFDYATPPFGGYPGNVGSTGGLALGLAFLSDIQVFMFMEAVQQDRRTQVMQAPRITVFNGQVASISVQDQQFFITDISATQVGGQVFFTPTNQPFPLGVFLQVTPVVSADRRFVRLDLQPQMTNLASATVPLIPITLPGLQNILDGPGAGNTVVGQPVIMQIAFQQPTFATISIQTTVNVPDGGTVLLGGLKTMSEARNESGPPILSKIPYLNRLFKNVGYGREISSLMIMVTPRIIIAEEEEAIFLGQLEPFARE